MRDNNALRSNNEQQPDLGITIAPKIRHREHIGEVIKKSSGALVGMINRSIEEYKSAKMCILCTLI